MAHYVKFALPDGSTVIIESDGSGGRIEKARGPKETVESATETFQEAVDNARKAALVVLDKVRQDNSPDEVEITFGLKASAELGNLVVAKAGVEASYSVKLTWKKPDAKHESKS